jgi:hypothetical protein
LEVESRNIELFVKFGVGSEQNLKSTIKGEPVDVISAYSAADSIGSFKNMNIKTSCR